MRNQENNVILKKSYAFALKIIALYKKLLEQREYVISKQVLKSGTSIGAQINEAMSGESKKDFVHKLGIAVKEARETIYWLSLLNDSNYLESTQLNELIADCDEILRILNSIVLTTKQRYLVDRGPAHNLEL